MNRKQTIAILATFVLIMLIGVIAFLESKEAFSNMHTYANKKDVPDRITFLDLWHLLQKNRAVQLKYVVVLFIAMSLGCVSIYFLDK